MNEELQTVNQELQSKLDELSLASTDMANLLDSTSIATLFLDRSLNVRRFTTSMERIIRLLPGDVGRPITDIVSTLDFPELADTARQVMQSLSVVEREAAASDGRWFAVRVLPYRAYDDRVDGVVVTFTDITTAKSLEAALRQAQASLEARLADSATDSVTDGAAAEGVS
jgi:two-component system, chemotaxis family, CheB/CheR fusion protein